MSKEGGETNYVTETEPGIHGGQAAERQVVHSGGTRSH